MPSSKPEERIVNSWDHYARSLDVSARDCDLLVATLMLRIFVRNAQTLRSRAFTANAMAWCKAHRSHFRDCRGIRCVDDLSHYAELASVLARILGCKKTAQMVRHTSN